VTLIGPVNSVELAVGVEPSMVNRMLAPEVEVVIVTDWAVEKLPPAGLNVGVATVPPPPPPPPPTVNVKCGESNAGPLFS
jgi:hypothetical protein